MHIRIAAVAGAIITFFVSGFVAGCGGGAYGGGGGGSNPPASLNISVSPTTITLGQSATITWNSNANMCTASGSWTGSKTGSGSESVTPTATGTFTYSLVCRGGGYGDSRQGSATLTVGAARLAAVWVGNACCAGSDTIRIAGITSDAGDYRFLLLGTHYVGKAGAAPVSYAASDTALAGARLADPHGFRLLGIRLGESALERVRVPDASMRARDLVFSLPYAADMQKSAGIESLQGNYTTYLGTGYTLTVSVDATGQVSGIDTRGCMLTGQLAAKRVGVNQFDAVLDVSGCGKSNGRYTGSAALLTHGSAVSPELFLSTSNAESAIGWRLSR